MKHWVGEPTGKKEFVATRDVDEGELVYRSKHPLVQQRTGEGVRGVGGDVPGKARVEHDPIKPGCACEACQAHAKSLASFNKQEEDYL